MNGAANLSSFGIGSVFAALGDRLRLRIACCLMGAQTPRGLCVCELVDALGETQPNISRHLKLLQAAGLVTERREGRWIYHELTDSNHPLLQSIRTCLDAVCCCSDVQEDLGRLRGRLALREGGKCVVGTTPKERGGEGNERARLPVLQ
jgi:ArsR family transcriptional regulator, arsenate/arsenite/antimonite-responsive transcriptional repressor